MTSYLYGFTIGPVQDFIKAARRTRDLWFGSYMLSELTRTAGRALVELGMNCIYPQRELLRADDDGRAAPVPNRLLGWFEVDHEQQLQEYTAHVKGLLVERLHEFGRHVESMVKEFIDKEAFYQQLDDCLEVYAAWVPYEPEHYSRCRQRLEALLAGRKLIRDFQPYHGRPLPKSTFDGGRETVLRTEDAIPRLGIRKRESLDAIGLIKRLGGGPQGYPSVVRVAVDPWLRRISQIDRVKPALEGLKQVLNELCDKRVDVVSRTSPKDYPQYSAFPFDGQALLEGFMLGQEFRSMADQDRSRIALALQQLQMAVCCSKTKDTPKDIRPFPNPYVALLLADGDRMGAALNRLDSVEQHREFSRCLTRFSAQVNQLVAALDGVVVYAGGDDIFAFLPIDKCIAAARRLRDEFEQQVASFFRPEDKPTLSVGIAIAHCLEDLADLREMAEQAEQRAKQPDRNALYVQVSTRSGGTPIRFRGRWSDAPDQQLERWTRWMKQEKIPSTLGHEIGELARQYRFVEGLTKEWLFGELQRVLSRKRAGADRRDPLDPEIVENLSQWLDSDRPLESMMNLSDLLKLARWLASADITPGTTDGGEVEVG